VGDGLSGGFRDFDGSEGAEGNDHCGVNGSSAVQKCAYYCFVPAGSRGLEVSAREVSWGWEP
jgi:hypothetical protein